MLGRDLPERVVGDGLRLRQVLINLVDNGIKFTEEGSVTLTAERVSMDGDAQLLTFEITDTGIGIEQQELERLYDKFYQVETGRTRKGSGFGLGTAISKLIIEKMGGTIEVISTPGIGTTFSVQINLLIAEEESRDARILLDQYKKITIPGNLRVLVVDDQPTNLKMVEYHLVSAGCEVKCVGDGLAALHVMERESFDLVLMDIFMPGLDGLETTRRLRASGAEMPIVALTANAYNQEFSNYWEAGMNDILIKPFRKNDLLELITRFSLENSSILFSHPAATVSEGGSEFDIELLSLDFNGDNELLTEVLTGFLFDVNERLPLIRQGIIAGNNELVHRESHAIKGGAVNIRADMLAAAAERLEQKAKAGLAHECLPQLEDLDRSFRRVEQLIEELTWFSRSGNS